MRVSILTMIQPEHTQPGSLDDFGTPVPKTRPTLASIRRELRRNLRATDPMVTVYKVDLRRLASPPFIR